MSFNPEKDHKSVALQPVSPLDFQRFSTLLFEQSPEDLPDIGVIAYIPPTENAFPFEGLAAGQSESLTIQIDSKLAGLLNLRPAGSAVELDIWLGELFKHQEGGERVIRITAVEAFARGYQELLSRVGTGNAALQHMLESVGFKRKGYIESSSQSGYLYSLSSSAYIINMARNLA